MLATEVLEAEERWIIYDDKQTEIQVEISHEEEEKRQIEHQMQMLNERLGEINTSL